MRALTKQEKIMIAELGLLFILPLLPDYVLILTDNIIVRIILMSFVLASSLYGPYVLLLTFIVILAVFGLRNNIKINKIMKVPTKVPEASEIFETPVIDDLNREISIEQPSFQKPVQDSYDFSPQEDTGTNVFNPVDISIDQKEILPSPMPDGRAGGLFPNPP